MNTHSVIINVLFLVLGMLVNEVYHWLVKRFSKGNKEKTRVNAQALIFALVVLFSLATALQTSNQTDRAISQATQTADFAACLAKQNTNIINAITSNSTLTKAKLDAILTSYKALAVDVGLSPPNPQKVREDYEALQDQFAVADMQRIPYDDFTKGKC